MLWRCGLRARYVTPASPVIPTNISGVVIGGGNDVEPQHYGLTGDAGATYDPKRDELELEIFKSAYDRQLPVLGICRGAQLMNIGRGGNLHQDLRPLRQNTPNKNTIFRIKEAVIEPGSKLRAIVGGSPILINSLHNQAIHEIGAPFRLAATDLDGFVQAIENPQHEFMIGVQWHPEYLPYARQQMKLFVTFARAVRAFAGAN